MAEKVADGQQEEMAASKPANQQASSSTSSQLENIKVAVRLRPFTEREKQRNSRRIVDIELNTVALYNPKSNGLDSSNSVKKFTFDYSYWSHDGFKRNAEGVNVPDEDHHSHSKYVGQEKVFEDLGAFLLENAMQGYNSALLAYGQTGSGKSYTVSGYGQNEGILPRFARALFVELEKRSGQQADQATGEQPTTGPPGLKNRYEVSFSMIEIYNEVVRDLLARDHQVNLAAAARRGLKVREHPKRGFFVEGLTSYPCMNKEEIEQRIEEGQLNKSIAATSMNETSSRGHTIYEFRIKQYRAASGQGQLASSTAETLTTSVVQLVDLAGSERLAVHVTGQLGGDSFIGSRSSSPYSQMSTQLQRIDDSASNINGHSSTVGRTKSVARKVVPTSASSSTASSSTTATAPNQQQTSSLRRPVQQQSPASFAMSANVDSHRQRFKESVSINQSLSALGNCIQVLSQYSQQMDNKSINSKQLQLQQPKIPYRDSVLTKLLNRCCLNGNSKVVIIATLSPADANYDDTLSTLRFADRAKQIKTHATVNRTSDGTQDTKMVNHLQKENQRLKQMIDGRATRSDDSSQTSNFDDTENMIDNFNGPAGSSSSSSGPTRTSAPNRQSGPGEHAISGTSRSRTTVRRPAGQTGAIQASSTATSRHKSRSRSQRLAGASSNPSLAMNEQQMRRIVSPAAGKLAKEAEDKEEEEAYRQATSSQISMKKSRSMGTGLAQGDKASPSPTKRSGSFVVKEKNNDTEDQEDDEDIELAAVASNLLDEIDLNDLADIDEGGLLSPDSDDSFAALAEDNLTNEEKISILNKLLSNSNVANKIRKQYELQHKNLLQQQQQHPLPRPNRTGPAHRQEEENIQRVSAISSNLKLTNPYLSNLNQDEQLTGMIAYIIKQGEMIVGKNNDCDILLYGPELRGRHAKITRVAKDNDARLSEVFIEPIVDDVHSNTDTQHKSGTTDNLALMVNGNPVQLNQRQQLHHCDRILFGSNAYFVFIDQASAGPSATVADQDLVTYDMAHNEVLRKVMSEAKIEAVIKDINNYTHRPGTGKHKAKAADDPKANNSSVEPKLSTVKSSRLMRSMTIHGDHDEDETAQNNGRLNQPIDERPESRADSDTAKRQVDDEAAGPTRAHDDDQDYREKLMDDTYEYAMPVAEVNAIAKEMQIKVTYGLKILTGEEQLPELFSSSSSSSNYNMDSNGSDDMSSLGGSSLNGGENKEQQQQQQRAQSSSSYEHQATSPMSVSHSIKPETLDIPPALHIHVHLEDQRMDFYWSKEKFQARRFKILELYGAWDVGGKAGLVEHLIEQSKYQSDYMIDPFIDDPQLSQVLIGHAQVTLRPISHGSDLNETYDILDLNDELAGSITIQAVPCRQVEPNNRSVEGQMFRPLNEEELHENLVENPSELLGQRLIFMIRIVCCQKVNNKYRRVYCQYTLNRDKELIRTNLARDRSSSAASAEAQQTDEPLNFEHSHFVVIEQVNQDHLDFFQHGFLPIQVVGQYNSSLSSTALASAHQTSSSSSAASASSVAPTLITTIINSINKYKFRMEQQAQQQQQQHHHHQSSSTNFNGMNNYSSSIYTNSVTDSAKSNRVTSSGMMNSNSGASSVASTSATVNLFDQQNDDDEGINSMNGLSQENIIDMILTKRKLDRAENQLHYLKRTINIAEHYNKKQIPVKTVKKLLNSYGHEIESGGLEEMVADVNVKGRATNTKNSACIVQ